MSDVNISETRLFRCPECARRMEIWLARQQMVEELKCLYCAHDCTYFREDDELYDGTPKKRGALLPRDYFELRRIDVPEI